VAQFDAHRLADGTLVVDLQTDLIGLDATRPVAPLLDGDRHAAFPVVTPVASFEGRRRVVRVPQAAAVTARALGRPVGALRGHGDALLRAVDVLTRAF
jgi:toxin CcdB